MPFSTFAADKNSDGITNPDPVTDSASGKLNLTKNLTAESDGTYDITMESYATGEVNSFTEKVPTDFVVVVDQSGSMSETDMPSDYTTASSKYLEDIATSSSGYYYYDSETGNYYRVYAVKGYLYEYFAENTKWVRDIVHESNAGLTWFQREGDANFDVANQYYFKTTDGVYRPVTVSIAGKVARYELKFRYTDANGKTVYFHYPDKPYYKPWVTVGHVVQDPYTDGQPLYEAANWAVKRVFSSDDTAYTYATVLGWLTTGMYINYPMYKRHVGYTELRYRDINGVEHTVPASNGSSTWEYCNSSSQAITTYNGSTRPTYSGLYTESGTNKSRLSALKEALTQFAGAVANETDSFGAVDNKVSILGFSSSGYNNTELLTGDNVTISNNNGVQKSTADKNESKYYGTALVNSTNGTAGTVNSQITSAINAITANGGTQPEDGLNMAYKVLTNRSTTKYTVRSGADKGSQVDRNTIVIFFTDGHPGDYAHVDMYSEANDVVEAAKQIKDYGTSLFSIGVFGESDGNPLTYPAHKVTSADSDYEYDLGWMRTITPSEDDGDGWYYYYLNRNWLPNDSANYGSTANDTIYDYMSVVSSNYPDANEFMNVDSTGLADTTDYSSYLAMCNAVRSSSTAEATNKYYRMASNQDTLVAAFLQAVTMMNDETSTTELGETAIFKDTVNTEDFDVSNATYNVQWQPIKKSGDDIVNNGSAETKVNESQVPADGKINYTGFDYSNYYVSSSKTEGYKLIVKISGLVPTRASDRLTSNVGNAGIYGPEDEDPTVSIGTPTLDNTSQQFHIQVGTVGQDGSIALGDMQDYTFKNGYYDSQTDKSEFNKLSVLEKEDGEYKYLYGGLYEDADFTIPVTSLPGTTFEPKPNETYYIKQVDRSYMNLRTIYIRYGNELRGTYDVVNVDSINYSNVGFAYDSTEDVLQKNKYESIDIITYKSGKKVTDNATYATLFGNGKSGYLVVDPNNRKEYSGTVQPYWITMDGVKVTGPKIRTLTNGSYQTGTETAGKISVTAVEGFDSSTATPLNSQTVFVAAGNAEDEIEPEDRSAALKYVSLSLDGDIALNFYMQLGADAAKDEDAYMLFDIPGMERTQSKVKLSDAKVKTIDGQTYYMFTVGTSAKDMTGKVNAQFIQSDGTESKVYTYTVKQYCEYIRNHADSYGEKAVALAEAIQNYGGYAQEYFKYNMEDLANIGLSLTLPEVNLDDSFLPAESGSCTGLTYKGTSLLLKTATSLKHYFALEDPNQFVFEANGKELEVGLNEDNGLYYVKIDRIFAGDLDKPVKLTVTNIDDGSSYTLSYSVYSNIKKALEKNKDTTTVNMMKALYAFGEAAKAYFAGTN